MFRQVLMDSGMNAEDAWQHYLEWRHGIAGPLHGIEPVTAAKAYLCQLRIDEGRRAMVTTWILVASFVMVLTLVTVLMLHPEYL